MTYSIPLPWTKPPVTANRVRGNVYARNNEVQKAKEAAVAAIVAAKLPAIVACEVELHLRAATRQRRDADGLYPTLKVAQDALVLAGVLRDDSWVSVPAATCRIHDPGEPAMWLELTNVVEYEVQP